MFAGLGCLSALPQVTSGNTDRKGVLGDHLHRNSTNGVASVSQNKSHGRFKLLAAILAVHGLKDLHLASAHILHEITIAEKETTRSNELGATKSRTRQAPRHRTSRTFRPPCLGPVHVGINKPSSKSFRQAKLWRQEKVAGAKDLEDHLIIAAWYAACADQRHHGTLLDAVLRDHAANTKGCVGSGHHRNKGQRTIR